MLSSSLSWLKKNLDLTVLSVFILVVIVYAFQLGGWNQPLILDRTFHLYSAQLVAKGAIPYIDYFNVHPPLGIMLIAFPMYLFPGLQTGAGPSIVHSIWTILWSIGGIIALYYIAKKITGSWLGGLLSISFWMFLTPLFVRHYSVGQNRILVTSSILIAMALLQRGKWLWAGFSLAFGFMTYYPSALAGIAVILLILGQKSWVQRLKATAKFSAGFFTIVGMVLLWLLYKGALVEWFDVTLRWPFALEAVKANIDKSFLDSFIDRHDGLLRILRKGYKIRDVNLIWLPIAGVAGCVYFFIKTTIQKNLRTADLFISKEIAPAFITTAMFYLYLLVEKGPLDGLILESFLTIWVSVLIIDIVSPLKNISFTGYYSSFAIIYVVLILFGFKLFNTMTSVFDRGVHILWRKENLEYRGSVHLQTEASQKLFENYSREKKILVLGDLWFLNVTNRENPSRFYHTGKKMQLAAELAEYVTPEKDIWDELAELNSDLILISSSRKRASYGKLTEQLVDMNYACVGEASDVFFLIPRNDISALSAIFSMQQLFQNAQSTDEFEGFDIVDIDVVGRIKNLAINEIVPGILLLGYQIDLHNSKTVTLYWWNWLESTNHSPDILIEVELNGEIVLKQSVKTTFLPKYQVLKQVIEIPDFEEWAGEGNLSIFNDTNRFTNLPCLSDFTTGPINIPLSSSF